MQEENAECPDDHQRLIKSHQRQLRDYILLISPNYSAMQDILQETNRILWEKRNTFQPGTNFLAWSRKVAQFQTMSFLKRQKSKSWLYFNSDLVEALAKESESRNEMEEERLRNLSGCLKTMTESDQTLVRLRYEMQMPLKEISEQTSRSEGGLKQAFLRIRKTLRECIERKTLRND